MCGNNKYNMTFLATLVHLHTINFMKVLSEMLRKYISDVGLSKHAI